MDLRHKIWCQLVLKMEALIGAHNQRILWYCYTDVLDRPCASPHFHALYAEYGALINIQTLKIINGDLPKRALSLVLEWANEHRAELMEDWELCEHLEKPKKIMPLK